MAEKHGLGIKPIQYQNTISPPWLTNATIVFWLVDAAAAIWIWYFHGWQQGLGAVVAALVLPAVFQAALPPRQGSTVYLRNSFQVMNNRQANYARDNDKARAMAMEVNISLLLDVRPDLLDAYKDEKGA
ncbi:hypothetical protein [Rhizobium sp. BK376]|uniref:hypothetical protein n=1 Tax=Rhizobium sp. BK376 TaxID=2512149 RepID=UPI00104FBA1D|nr:hypothetical protein [Rhizobium sp. BK376]